MCGNNPCLCSCNPITITIINRFCDWVRICALKKGKTVLFSNAQFLTKYKLFYKILNLSSSIQWDTLNRRSSINIFNHFAALYNNNTTYTTLYGKIWSSGILICNKINWRKGWNDSFGVPITYMITLPYTSYQGLHTYCLKYCCVCIRADISLFPCWWRFSKQTSCWIM